MNTRRPSTSGTNRGMGAALGAAALSAACCTIPLALVSLGIGGAWIGALTALEPYRWIFVGLAVAALGFAVYNEWQLSRRPDCNCEGWLSPTLRRSVLTIGALAVVALIASPWLLDASPAPTSPPAAAGMETAPPDSAQETTPPDSAQETTPADTARATAPLATSRDPAAARSFQQVVLTVKGMTCSSCEITVRKALERVDGVYHAEVTYEPPEAVVRFDPSRTSVSALTQATTDVGFPSRKKNSSARE